MTLVHLIMARIVYLLLFASTLLTSVDAAIRVNARERLASFHGNLPRHVRYKRSSGSLSDIFGLQEGESLEVKSETITAQGTKLYKMIERFKGNEIFDTTVTMATLQGTPIDAHGYIVQDIHKDVTETDPSLSENELFEILIRRFKDQRRRQDIMNRKLTHDYYVDSNNIVHRVALVEYLITTSKVSKRPTAIINVQTGEIIHAWNNLNTCRSPSRGRVYGGNYKIGKIRYGIRPQCLKMKARRGMCFLENRHVKVVDMYNSEKDYITKTARFRCNGRYGDRINGAYSPALDALHHGTVIGKMFRKWFKAKPLMDKLILRVHYSHNYKNAFWNGHNCSFGDGVPGDSYPFTSLDIIGHEVGHGITEQNSRLMYIGQAGAINEAFSDITGETAEIYADIVDWRVGYAIQVEGSMRYFGNPEMDNRSISHVSQYRDDMNTHDTSGIFNYVFYLLCYMYGNNPRDVYSVFLHANRMYWHPMTTFDTGACDVMLSAYDLGLSGEPFARAFSEVGINVCDIDYHVLYLRHNVTHVNVTVSDTRNPVFGLELPTWADEFYVESSSKYSDVFIRIYEDRWTWINETTPTLIQGHGAVYYKLSRYHPNVKLFVRLSSDSPNILEDVKIRGGYSCQDHLHTYSHKEQSYFYWECYGIDIEKHQ